MPAKKRVEATKEDVKNWLVLTVFEKLAEFARMLEIVSVPFGFVIAAELRRNDDT